MALNGDVASGKDSGAVGKGRRGKSALSALERERIFVRLHSHAASLLPERLAALTASLQANRRWAAKGCKGAPPPISGPEFNIVEIDEGLAALREMKRAHQPAPRFRRAVARAYRAYLREVRAPR